MTEFKGTPVRDDETLLDIATEALGAMVLAKARESAIARLSEALNRDEVKQRALPELLALAERLAAGSSGNSHYVRIDLDLRNDARALIARIKGEMT